LRTSHADEIRVSELYLDAHHPLRRTFFGTLCAIDPRPARLDTPQTIGMFKLFSELNCDPSRGGRSAGRHRARLLSERENFGNCASSSSPVLGHDLRNPLASIAPAREMLTKEDQKEPAGEILGLMQKSVARMSALIDNVLDFARGDWAAELC